MRELHRTPSRPAGRTGPQGRLSHSVLQLFRNALAIRAEDELIDLLQIGKAVYTDVAKQMRTELWLSVLKVKRLGSIAARNYRLMLAKPLPEEVSGDIEKDVGRTFPAVPRFAKEEGKQQLQRLLRAYAAYDPEVNYCQGMNFMAALLLTWLPDEAEAFGVLVVLLNERGLRDLYKTDMCMLQVRLWQVGQLLPPELSAHMEAHGTMPVLYASSWLLTAFAADFPLFFSSRVMDVVLTDRYIDAIMKVVVGIVRECSLDLMAMNDMEAMVDLLRCGVPAWPRERLHSVLTQALNRAWTPAQAAVLRQRVAPESVADAVERSRRLALLGMLPEVPEAFVHVGTSDAAEKAAASVPNSPLSCSRPCPAITDTTSTAPIHSRLRPTMSLAGDKQTLLSSSSVSGQPTSPSPRMGLQSAHSVASSLGKRALHVHTRALSFAWAQHLPPPRELEPVPRTQRQTVRPSKVESNSAAAQRSPGDLQLTTRRSRPEMADANGGVSESGAFSAEPNRTCSGTCTPLPNSNSSAEAIAAPSNGYMLFDATRSAGATSSTSCIDAEWSTLEDQNCRPPLHDEEAWSDFADFTSAEPSAEPVSPLPSQTGPSTPDLLSPQHSHPPASPPTPLQHPSTTTTTTTSSSPCHQHMGAASPMLGQCTTGGGSRLQPGIGTSMLMPKSGSPLPGLRCEGPSGYEVGTVGLPIAAAAALGRSTSLFSGLVGEALGPEVGSSPLPQTELASERRLNAGVEGVRSRGGLEHKYEGVPKPGLQLDHQQQEACRDSDKEAASSSQQSACEETPNAPDKHRARAHQSTTAPLAALGKPHDSNAGPGAKANCCRSQHRSRSAAVYSEWTQSADEHSADHRWDFRQVPGFPQGLHPSGKSLIETHI